MHSQQPNPYADQQAIAIVGMAGKFPDAATVEQFWDNLCAGREALRHFDQEAIRRMIAGMDPGSVPHLVRQVQSGNWVPAGFCLDDIDAFDAGFFGYTPGEAELLDPQQRLFLEVAWAAMEDAAFVPDGYPGSVGLFAGTGLSRYFLNNVYSNREIMYSSRDLVAGIGNEPDYLTNRVAYKLNLKGPAVSVQTACSTSLVAIHLAAQSLLAGECDLCLAGGSFVAVPGLGGYYYQEGSMASSDGHIRAFDARAEGTVFAEGGVGVVVLKRLEDALTERDHIYGVILGSAVNNDGAFKSGYTAPGLDGQVAVVSEALAVAGLSPQEVGYVEAHGTGTPLGDPIEVKALSTVYRRHTQRTGYCAIGSLKPNVGHLAPAAGVAGVIKAALTVRHGLIPPSINYENPNPHIDFASSPFFVNTQLRPWQGPRVAAVSSFGIGGTNAHLLLGEPPPVDRPAAPAAPQGLRLFPLSARTPKALGQSAGQLADFLERHPDTRLDDLALTLQQGRKAFEVRGAVSAASLAELRDGLTALAQQPPRAKVLGKETRCALLLSGQGSQYPQMGRQLYRTLPVFRDTLDRCLALLANRADLELRPLLFPDADTPPQAVAEQLRQTAVAQPLLFAFEYALARQLEELGIHGEALLGHSLGELVAACLAGVFDLEQALELVALRGRLMQSMAPGAMLSVSLDAGQIDQHLTDAIVLAADNAPRSCVLSGPTEALTALQARLEEQGVACRPLLTSHAFHSPMMEGAAARFKAALAAMTLQAPCRPFVSNVTGTWITAEQAQSPDYWSRHLLGAVRLRQGVETLLKEGFGHFIEVGPGNTLATFVSRIAAAGKAPAVAVPLVRHPREDQPDEMFFRQALGRLWAAGLELDWEAVDGATDGRRIPLPTYPFARDRYWVDPARDDGRRLLGKQPDLADWFYVPSFKRQPLVATADPELTGQTLLLLLEAGELAEALTQRLTGCGARVVRVEAGEDFARPAQHLFRVRPGEPGDYEQLLQALGPVPVTAVIHGWNLTPVSELNLANHQGYLERGFHALLGLVQVLDGGEGPVALLGLTSEVHDVNPDEPLNPAKAAALGVHLCAGFECRSLRSRNVDFAPAALARPLDTAAGVVAELAALLAEQRPLVTPADKLVARRGRYRWVAHYEKTRVPEPARTPPLRPRGSYLITGGLGGLGLEFADWLARQGAGRLALLGRSAFPDRRQWPQLLANLDPQDPQARRIRRLQAIEARGVEVAVLQADAANADQMTRAVAWVDEHWGELHGVIHAAGVAGGGMMAIKTREAAERVLDPKIRGALLLEELLGDRPLDFLVLFSSLFAVIGGLGQVDYAGANNFLDALARCRAREGRKVLSLNWSGWSEVGMAADHGKAARLPELPAGRQFDHPLLFAREDRDGVACFTAWLREVDLWALQEHQLAGQPVLPGTALLEMVRAAFARFSGSDRAVLEEVAFHRPLAVDPARLCRVTVELRPAAAGQQAFTVLGPQGESVCIGRIGPLSATAPLIDLTALATTCTGEVLTFAPGQSQLLADDGFLTLGPRWQVLRRLQLGERELLGELALDPAFAGDLEQFVLHPALLDMATGPITGHLLARLDQTLEGEYLPAGYGRLEQYGPLPARLFSHVRLEALEPEAGEIRFAIDLYDPDGRLRVAVRDFTLRQVPATLTAPPARQPDFLDEAIAPREGMAAFARLLATDQPQWVINPVDLAGLLDKLQGEVQAAAAPVREQRLRRDEGEVAPPTNRVEALLVEVFETVLGVEPVGIHDNFFELGGDSVVGIQIVAQARARGVILKPNQLFSHQSVAELAQVAQLPDRATAAEGASTPHPTPVKNLTEAEPGSRADFAEAELSADDLETLFNSLET